MFPIVWAGVREVHHQLEGLVAEGLQGQDHVVNQQVAVRLTDLRGEAVKNLIMIVTCSMFG